MSYNHKKVTPPLAYKVMYHAVCLQFILLQNKAWDQQDEIQQLKRQLQKNKKFPYLATALKSTARQINLTA